VVDLCELHRFLCGSHLCDGVDSGQKGTLKAKSLQGGIVVRRWSLAEVASQIGRYKEVEVLRIMREGWHSSNLLVRLPAIRSEARSDQ
jgi:hypothetical protein